MTRRPPNHPRRQYQSDGQPGAIGAALIRAMEADLAGLRVGLSTLAVQVEEGRVAGRDVTGYEIHLGELTAAVGTMAAEVARLGAAR